MKSKNIFKKSVIALGLGFGLSTQVYAATCYLDRIEPVQISNAAKTAHVSFVAQQLEGINSLVNQQINKQSDAIAQGITVWTAQKGVSAQQQAAAIKNNTQIEAQAVQEIDRSQRIRKVLKDYSPQSMGYKTCQGATERAILVATTQNTQNSVPYMIKQEVTAAPGVYSPRIKAMATRLALHNKMYCTQSQADSGLCSAEAPSAGKSLMAATMFEPASLDSQAYQDKSALINNMVGLPDDPIPAIVATTAQGQSFADLKRRKDAIKSTAINSLKSIQADWSVMSDIERGDASSNAKLATESSQLDASDSQKPANTATPAKALTSATAGTTKSTSATAGTTKADTTPQPLMILLKREVDKYLGGGTEYVEWSKTLAGQEEKGVMTELLKVKALRLYMQAQEYKQLSRMEAMLAANVSAQTENTGLNGRVELQRQIALKSAIQDKLTP